MDQIIVQIPAPVIIGGKPFSHRDMVTHILDVSKVYQKMSTARNGFKTLDAIDSALAAGKNEYVLSEEQWKLLSEAFSDEEMRLPRWNETKLDQDNKVISFTEIPIGMFQYLPLIDPILNAKPVEARPASVTPKNKTPR